MFILDLAQSAATQRSAEASLRTIVLRAMADRRADARPTFNPGRVASHRLGHPFLTPRTH